MRKLKVYLDTSVVSYLYQADAPEKMQNTLDLWDLFKNKVYEVYISDIVIREISGYNEEKLKILLDYLEQIDYNIIETDEDTVELAGKFIDFGILKQKSFDDCQHIAAAILAGCDIITSWNFKHIVNVKTVRGVKVITTLEGYKDLLIYPPSVLIESEDDDTMNKPTISERFDVEDIRKIREYNSLRHIKMTPAEIVEDTKKGAAELLARLKENKMMKV